MKDSSMSEYETGELITMPYETAELEQTHEVVDLAPNGLGYGEGKISTQARIEKGEISSGDLQVAGEIIQDDPEVFVLVDTDAPDDGCGDGRRVKRVLRLNEETDIIEELNKSRRRAKVFGGGLMVASSMWRSIAGAPQHGETVLGDREFIAGKLKEMNIAHGAHTDVHADGDKCGCGAIDGYPDMTENAGTYKESIINTLQALYGDAFDDNRAVIDSVFADYGILVDDKDYFSNAQGAKTRDLIASNGSVIKELDADHLEGLVVLNDIEGTTFDQRKFDEKLQSKGVESEIQVFVVDTWRGQMYADAVAQVAVETLDNVDYEEARQKAYADFLIRTLAIAATLTKGDLEVKGRMREGRSDFALTA